MKLKLSKAILYALLGLVCLVALVKVVGFIKQPDTQSPTSVKQLAMDWQEVVATRVSSDEKDHIVAFVDTFENAIAQRDSEKVLSFFSTPETDAEQDELDFILWKDVDPTSEKGSRLFRTAGYNFRYGAHYVRNVGAQGANRRVLVDEMRILHANGEGAVGYFAQVSQLVIELRATSHGYQIVRYYHEGNSGKYEGFVAE